MSLKIRLKHSATANKAPLPTDLVEGELALNTNSTSPAAYIKDSTGTVVKLAGAGSVSTPDATTTVKGITQLADAAALAAGTTGRVVDAAQLKTAQAAQAGSATAPAAPTTGQVWINNSVTPAVTNVWNGTTWIPQAGATISSATAPAAPATGQVWINTSVTPNVTSIWDGAAWVAAKPDGAAVAAIANDAKYATKAELATENLWDKAGTTLSPATAGDLVAAAALPTATEIAAGIVELATAAETTTGTDATRAVHPAGLKSALTFTQAGTGAKPRSYDSKFKDVVSVKDFGAVGDGVADDTVAVQAAVTYCNTNNKDLEIPGLCLLTGSVNIDRMIDSAAADHYFTIFSSNGGGFVVASDMTMFSTTLVNPAGATLPVTQMVRFSGIKFEADVNTRTAYVLDGNKFLRTTFNGCSFRKIRCLTTGGSTYVQSIYFVSCQARRWTGSFFASTGAASYDIKAHSCLMEAGVTAFELHAAVGCSFYQNCIEGMATGTALSLNGAQGASISGNYIEGNAVDIALNGGKDILGVSLVGNYFAGTTSPNGYNVFWGTSVSRCFSSGNYSSARLHNLSSANDVVIQDYAPTAATSLSNHAWYPAKTTEADDLGVGIRIPTDRGHFHKASNCRIFLSDDGISSAYGGFFTGYSLAGQGGHAAIGTSEAGVKTNILTINYAKQVYPSTDNVSSLGTSGQRWTTVFATTALINTSDANQKQQIAELSEAERNVATTVKGLIRKFKFNDAVEAKGDDARIHVGVIAQDVEQAFIDEGLDPAGYALFCRDEWWELDGQTVSDDTPGATRRERLGIRYEELLAFVIAVM